MRKRSGENRIDGKALLVTTSFHSSSAILNFAPENSPDLRRWSPASLIRSSDMSVFAFMQLRPLTRRTNVRIQEALVQQLRV
jgi:hypothetical protein